VVAQPRALTRPRALAVAALGLVLLVAAPAGAYEVAAVPDGGTLRADRRAAIDELHASAERYQQTVLESFGQVADVLDSLSQDAASLTAQTHALATAQSSLELSRRSYGAGNTGILQVLDAQRQRQQAQLGFVRAQAQQYLDTTQLFLALGGGRL